MADSEKNQNPITVVNSHIDSHSFSRIYLFFGDEQYLIKQYVNNLVNAVMPDRNSMSFSHYISDKCDVNSICSDAVTMPFFDEFKVALIEDSGYFNSSNDKIKDMIPEIGEQNILIFSEMNVDKRTSTYKAAAKYGTVLEFATPSEDDLIKWVIGRFTKDNIRIQNGVPEMLVSVAGENMLNLSNEVEKLSCYAMNKGTITLEDIGLLCNSKIEDKIFEMCDAIGRHDSRTAISRYNDLVALKTSPMMIISMISRHFRILSQLSFIQSGKDKKMAAKDKAALLGIKSFAVNKYLTQLNNQTTSDLLRKSELCMAADFAVKSGQMSDINSAEKLILDLL